MKWNETPEFLALQKKWRKKLKQSGFEDIESEDRDILWEWDSLYYKQNYSPEEFDEKMRYYQLASQFLYDHQWASEKDKLIWFLHCEGSTTSQISKKVRKSENFVKTRIRYYAKFIKNL